MATKKKPVKKASKRVRKPAQSRRPKPAAEPAEAAPKVEQAEAQCAPPQDRPKTLAELYPVQFSEDWIIEATAAGKMFNRPVESVIKGLCEDVQRRFRNRFEIGVRLAEIGRGYRTDRLEKSAEQEARSIAESLVAEETRFEDAIEAIRSIAAKRGITI